MYKILKMGDGDGIQYPKILRTSYVEESPYSSCNKVIAARYATAIMTASERMYAELEVCGQIWQAESGARREHQTTPFDVLVSLALIYDPTHTPNYSIEVACISRWWELCCQGIICSAE